VKSIRFVRFLDYEHVHRLDTVSSRHIFCKTQTR